MANHLVAQLQIPFQFAKALGRIVHPEEDVVPFPEILDRVRQTAAAPLINVSDFAAQVLNPGLDDLDHGLRIGFLNIARDYESQFI